MDAVLPPAEAGPPVQERLQEAALAGEERERALAVARLGELVRGGLDRGEHASQRVVVSRATRYAEGQGVDRVDRIGHRRTVPVGARRVVVEVVQADRLRLRPLPRVGAHDDIGLLDGVAGVALELRRNSFTGSSSTGSPSATVVQAGFGGSPSICATRVASRMVVIAPTLV
jgi:hypothetical protein